MKLNLLSFLIITISTICAASGIPQSIPLEREDTKAWHQMVWVAGEIHIINHPQLGRTPANGEVVAFRQMEDSHIIVAVRTDINGKYEIFLSPGRYKIIIPGLNAEQNGLVDRIAPGQARYLQVQKGPIGMRFNIEIANPR